MTTAVTEHTDAQTAAIARAGRTHTRLERAELALHRALGRAQHGRSVEWASEVADALAALRDAIHAHRRETGEEHGLYGELRIDAPWLLPRLEQLTRQMQRIEAEAADLALEVERVRGGDRHAMAAIRGDAERLMTMLRDLMAKEADLVWERFNEPIALD